jgi:hypothetical protein
MNIISDNIYPLIVPADYYSQNVWDLPHYPLSLKSLILTWVKFDSDFSMVYLSRKEYQELIKDDNNWQRKSFENLRLLIGENENFFTNYKISDDQQYLSWICFMNSDGIGSSRVLLAKELSKAFPNGYYISLPDRSCGLIISKDVNKEELNEIETMIKQMQKGATISISNILHPNKDFDLPEDWTNPIDNEFSEILVNGILKIMP